MPRVAKEIKCNENDILALQYIVQNPLSDPHLVDKATAILLCIDGMENKDVAAQLNVRKNTVGDWRKAYIEGGIEGLKGKKRPGRRGNKSPDMRELVKEKLKEQPDTGKSWTAKTLAASVGTSVDTVRRALREENISLERRTRWEIPVESIPSPASIGFAGIYLSDCGKAVVIFSSQDNRVGTGHGNITGRTVSARASLEEIMTESGYISITDALEILSSGHGDAGKRPRRNVSMQEYLNGIGIASAVRDSVLLHAIVLPGKEAGTPALSCTNLSVTVARDFDSWLTLIRLWVEPLCGAAGARIREALSRYTDEYMATREPVIWNAGVLDVLCKGNGPEESVPDAEDVFSDPSVDNILRVSATILDREGREIHREAEIPNGVPGLAEISYGSRFELGASVGKVERAVSDGMSGVAKGLCEGYLHEALKKTGNQGMR